MKVINRADSFNFHFRGRWTAQNIVDMLKTLVYRALRFLYHSMKLILLIAVIVLITLVFNFLIFSWIGNNADSNNNNDDEDRTIPERGTIDVRGLEIYGGDIITADSGNVYLDWGELTLRASKNASFYVLSNSNVNVTLGLNVTAWDPAGLDDTSIFHGITMVLS